MKGKPLISHLDPPDEESARCDRGTLLERVKDIERLGISCVRQAICVYSIRADPASLDDTRGQRYRDHRNYTMEQKCDIA